MYNIKLLFLIPVLIIGLLSMRFGLLYAQEPEENLKVLDQWVEWANAENMLQDYLNRQAFHLLDQREEAIAQIKTKTDWLARQQEVKGILTDIVGKLPERTPLNPTVTGVIHREGFRVEKIMYESVPGFRVTGCLFFPEDGKGKKPAVLNVIGHSGASFRRDIYQNFILNLVKKGFIVFAIDPIGQGERLQYFDQGEGKSTVGGSTAEHSYITNQCLLAGFTASKYFIWDGIRAIDYLVSRSEVDPQRIGLTGLSGGGTQTAMIAPFDERIKASAPTCYITSFRRLLQSIGPADGEQNFYHELARGIDHADLLEVQAPRPTLIVSTTRDFFSIQGARETYAEVKRAYGALGEEENISMSEADHVHGFTRKNNEATYAFFQKTLDLPGSPTEEHVEVFAENELNITSKGQLSTSVGGKAVFDLMVPEIETLVDKLKRSRNDNPQHLEAVLQKARELSGFILPGDEIHSIYRGRHQRDGYSVEMYAIEVGQDYVIPLLLAVPDQNAGHSAVIYLHPDGKEHGILAGGDIEQLVRRGFIVAAPDLLGIGETRSNRDYPGSHGYGAMLIGRSIVGIQAGDIVRVVNFLKMLPGVMAEDVHAVAFDEQCPVLLHAAAFEPDINGMVLVRPLVSYANVALTRHYAYDISFDWGVAGALTAYDLPDLAACIAPRKLVFIGLVNGKREMASQELVSDAMNFPGRVYEKSMPGNLKVMSVPGGPLGDALADFFNE